MADRPLTIDFGALRLADLPEATRAFFAWWRGELAEILPGRRTETGVREQALLFVRGERWLLKTSDRVEPVVLDTRLEDGALGERMLEAAHGAPLSGLKIVLPRENVLLRRLEMPAMSDARVRQAVELQIDRISPFKADTVRFAHRIAGRDAERHLVAVDVAIVPHARARPVEERLRAMGFAAAGVDVEGEDGRTEGFDLKEPASADEIARKRNRNLMLGAAALVIWVLAVYAWSDAGAREESSWQARIAELRPGAERSASLRRQLEAYGAQIAEANRHDPAAMLNILAELTHILPDTARVLEFKIEGDRLQIGGLAESGPPLIGLLEQSPMFADVQARSAFVRRAESAKERFDIGMRLERRSP